MMMIRTDITKTAAFTGHRFIRYKDRQQLKTNLERAITGCYHSGIRHFLCGMAAGFDMLAAETLLAMKANYPDIRLTAVIPFRGQSCKFNPTDKERYSSILGKADNVVCLTAVFSDATTICLSEPTASLPTTMASRKAARSTLAAGRSA